MAGIYIHIPFCRKACHYCNFHFSTTLGLKNDFTAALLKEIALQQQYFQGEPVETIYFGGGTPSLLEATVINSILDSIHRHYQVDTNPEITLEANPDDIGLQKLGDWKSAGINRLSIGVQSFFDEDLQWMNRVHHAQQAIDCIQLAREAGFDNLTIDLIYGTPTLTDEKWERNVALATSMQIPHLSCYALTVEPGTALKKMIELHRKEDIDHDKQARQFLQLSRWLENAGYEHYEISNFAKPGSRSRHNKAYWQGKKYLGLGPSAHSFNGSSRQWNIANNAQYIASLKDNKVPFETETLSPAQQLNEYIMTSLRTSEGTSLVYIETRFGIAAREAVTKALKPYLERRHCVITAEQVVLTLEGKLFADGIAAALFAG